MKLTKFLSMISVITALSFSQVVAASGEHGGGHAISEMSKIMMDLNHRPDSGGKRVLRDIVNGSDASENEKFMARVMLNLDHRASASEKARLREIVNDQDATEHERQLADILLRLNHKPSRSDKAKLRDMM